MTDTHQETCPLCGRAFDERYATRERCDVYGLSSAGDAARADAIGWTLVPPCLFANGACMSRKTSGINRGYMMFLFPSADPRPGLAIALFEGHPRQPLPPWGRTLMTPARVAGSQDRDNPFFAWLLPWLQRKGC